MRFGPNLSPRLTLTIFSILWAATLFGAGSTSIAQLQFEGVRATDFPRDFENGTLADLDEDGILDFVATGRTFPFQTELFFLPGTGGGDFGAPITLRSESGIGFVVEDIDRDHHLDVILGDTMTLLLGDGTGTFVPSTISPNLPLPGAQFFVRDFDLDTHLDLAVVDVEVRLYRGDGAGGFSETPPLNLESERIGNSIAGDFNGDGIPDLLALRLNDCDPHVCFSVEMKQLLGLGNGDFLCEDLDLGELVGSFLAAGDFDGDGRSDIILETSENSFASLSLSRGSETGLAAPETLISGIRAGRILSPDVDGDGDLDLILTHTLYPDHWNNRLSILLGDGQGNFGTPTSITRSATFAGVGDFDGDSILDLFVGTPDSFSIHSGRGQGEFVSVPTLNPEVPPVLLTAGDFNEDGLDDLATSSSGPHPEGLFSLLLGEGIGDFSVSDPIPGSGTSYTVPAPSVDFDGDGHLDLIAKGTSQDNRILFGDGNGDFPVSTTISSPTGFITRQFLHGDFDEDGHPDLVQATDYQVRLYRNRGDGSFDPARTTATVHNSQIAYAAVDVNEDGHLDLAGIVGSGFPVRYQYDALLGDGDGNFAAPQFSRPAEGGSTPPAVGDFNTDGHLDFAFAHRQGGILLLFANGDGTVAEPERILENRRPRKVVAADLDLDGHLDLAATGSNDDLLLLSGDGTGDFQLGPNFRVGLSPTDLIARDFDRDGDPDLAVGGSDLVLLFNATILPEHLCRVGSVDLRAGAPQNVLFVNQSPGVGPERRVDLSVGDSMLIEILGPPSGPLGPAKLVLWLWKDVPSRTTVQRLPADLGFVGLPTPLTPTETPQPRRTSNSLGHFPLLGLDRWPFGSNLTAPGPLGEILSIPRPATFYIQGLIEDRRGPNGVVAVTNGIEVRIESP